LRQGPAQGRCDARVPGCFRGGRAPGGGAVHWAGAGEEHRVPDREASGPRRQVLSVHRAIDLGGGPVLTFRLVAPRLKLLQDLLPRTVQRPAAMPVVRGLPVAVPGRQVAPHSARPRPMEDPVDHRPVIIPPRPVHVLRRQQRHQPHPLLISQVVTLQTLFVHTDDLRQDRQQDHGTRPSALGSLVLRPGAVALLIGGVGVANVMVISVLERRGEIGLRRALGATRSQVGTQFPTEALLLAGLGAAAGILLGVAATAGYTTATAQPTAILATAVWAGLGGALAAG